MKEFNFTTPQVIFDLYKKSQTAIRPRNRALFARAHSLLCEFRDRLSITERERKEMAAILKEEHGCILCQHWCPSSTNPSHHPCGKCKEVFGLPDWKWKGGAKL